MGVVPGVMGVAAFAPPLDGAGNSVKAQKALAFIAGHLNLNPFRHDALRDGQKRAGKGIKTGPQRKSLHLKMMQAFFIICNLSIKDNILSIFHITPHSNYNKKSVCREK